MWNARVFCGLRMRRIDIVSSNFQIRNARFALRMALGSATITTDANAVVPTATSDDLRPALMYTSTQRRVMDSCKELHASIMPLNDKVCFRTDQARH